MNLHWNTSFLFSTKIIHLKFPKNSPMIWSVRFVITGVRFVQLFVFESSPTRQLWK
jgi:hypothetical protein